MKHTQAFRKFLYVALVVSSSIAASMPAQAELSGALQAKVEKYKTRLTEWVRNPVLMTAVREANQGGSLAGMTNAKWDGLADTDPLVTAFQTNPAGRVLIDLEEDKGISKLYLRDAKGNIVASSNKPILFNNSNRAPFAEAFKGKPYAANEVKPDTTTQIKGVQLSVPLMDGGKPIGVLQTSVVAE